MSSQSYDWWRATLDGKSPPIHESEPQCGYFKLRDRRGLNKNLAPIKRPWVAAAIWRTEAGELRAEIAGQPVEIDTAWPYVAKYPIPYADYETWHRTEKWPEKAA
ncbi:hypothetical protein U2P60_14760 [Brucella sp. H1_1004]|uniref:hypothetical protein n=1 Tax=Brucella sp. H1_1004 TaxID=3110109 RepID=UPI0039B49BB6